MATTTTDMQFPTVPWWLVLIEGIAAIILGLLLFSSPAATIAVMLLFLGWYWLISGILSIVQVFTNAAGRVWNLIIGILGILAGIAVLNHPLWSGLMVGTTLVLLLGIQGLISGVIQLVSAARGGGLGIGVLGLINIVFGLWLVLNPFAAALALPWVLGILALAGGIAAVVAAFRLKGAEGAV